MTEEFDPFEKDDLEESDKKPKNLKLVLLILLIIPVIVFAFLFAISDPQPDERDSVREKLIEKESSDSFNEIKNNNYLVLEIPITTNTKGYKQQVFIEALVGFQFKSEYNDWFYGYYDEFSKLKQWEFEFPLQNILDKVCMEYEDISEIEKSLGEIENISAEMLKSKQKMILYSINGATSEIFSTIISDKIDSINTFGREVFDVQVGERTKATYLVNPSNSIFKDVFHYDNIFKTLDIQIISVSPEKPAEFKDEGGND